MKRFVFVAALLVSNFLFAGNPVAVQQLINHKDWSFVENKGQLMDAPTLKRDQRVSDVKYYSHEGNLHVFCLPNKISFVFLKMENEQNNISEATCNRVSDVGVQNFEPLHQKQPFKITTARMDLLLINANPKPEITATDQQAYYENYYTTGDANHGITQVHTYKTITYKNIYPYIDLILNCRKGQAMEYSFLVHPGGKVSDIKLQWKGIDKSEAIKGGSLHYSNALGSMEESAPKSFAEGKVIGSSFIRNGFNMGFKVEKYDKTKDLLIDPLLTWGTYYGGNSNDYAYGASADDSSNIYITGFTYSDVGIATSGAYQTSFSGSSEDAFLAKFSANGALLWATYYGGTKSNQARGICTDGSGNSYIVGQTNSTSGIATKGAYQTSYGDNFDGFLAKFNSKGAIVWATYFGGNGIDDLTGVSADNSGNVYIAGSTWSTNGIATSGAYQTSYAGGGYDGLIAKFSSAGVISWATYYGGSGEDHALAIHANAAGNVYVAGSTTSSSAIATSGAYQTTYGGNFDGFVTKFSTNGKVLWATYYGGTDDDAARAITTDTADNVCITGNTSSKSGIATSGAFMSALGKTAGSVNTFLAKFTSIGAIIWATYYGYEYDYAYGICSDNAGNIYITGLTQSDSGIATSGAYQTSFGGGFGYDAFLVKFKSSGALAWGTYYGGNDYDEAYGVCSDVFGNIYITGYTASQSGIATAGMYQTSIVGNYDAFLAKFRFKPYENDAGLDSVIYPNKGLCAGNYALQVQLHNYGSKPLDSVAIEWSVNNIKQPKYNWRGTLLPDTFTSVILTKFNFPAGKDNIKVWVTNPNGILDSVNQNDTFQFSITLNPIPKTKVGATASICFGASVDIGSTSTNGDSYAWTSIPPGYTSSLSITLVKPVVNTTYYLTETITATGCSNSDSVRIRVNPLPNADWSVKNDSANYNFYVKDSSLAKSSYTWDFGDGSSIAHGYRLSHSFSKNAKYTVKLTVLNSNGCSSEHDSILDILVSAIQSNDIQKIYFDIFPNPFIESTKVAYYLNESTKVKIGLFDLSGKEIVSIIDERQFSGSHSVEINAGRYHILPGIYMLKIATGEYGGNRKIVKL